MKPIITKILRIFFIVFILASASLFFFSRNEADPDLWGHLRYGQDIYQKFKIPRYDIYSYTFYGAKWINHEWLSELIFFIIFKFLKDTGLIILKVIFGIIITFLIFISISEKIKSIILKLLFILASLSVINFGFCTRPQIFTYLFFTIFVFFIDRFQRTAKPHWLYAIPLITLVWCNLHGGFIAGIGVFLLYFLFKTFQKKMTKALLIITLLTIWATFINPYGKELWLFLFRSLSKPRPNIFEWQGINLSWFYLDYFIVLSLAIIGILFSKSKRSAYEMTALFITLLFSFQHNRHIVLFVIVVAIYMPKYIDSFTKNWLINLEKRFSKSFFTIIFLCFLVYFFLMAPYRGEGNPLRIRIPQDKYPVDAIMFMKDNKITGNTFCFFNWAQMCIRELKDTNKVFFDGRYETVYSDDLIRNYFEILYGKKDYKDYLAQFPQTDIMLLHRFNPLANKLIEDKDWVLVYSSYLAWIFLKDNQRNKDIIENFKNNRLIYSREKPSFYLE